MGKKNNKKKDVARPKPLSPVMTASATPVMTVSTTPVMTVSATPVMTASTKPVMTASATPVMTASAMGSAEGVSGRVGAFSWFPGYPMQEGGWKRATVAFWAVAFVMVWVVSNAWICDDAFITFRTIDNWFHGYGLRWNPLERVQSYTHPLWMFLVAGVHGIVGHLYWATMALSLVLTALMLWLLFRHIARSTWHILLGALVLGFSRAHVDFATSGLENPLAHLLLVVFLLLFFRWVQDERIQGGAFGSSNKTLREEKKTQEKTSETLWFLSHQRIGVLVFLACLGVLNRTDHALLFGFPLLYAFWRTRWNMRLLGVVFLSALPLFAWEVFSLIYYGLLVPNTAYAKLSTGLPFSEKIVQGLYYFFYSLQKDALTIVFLVGMIGWSLFRFWWKERHAVAWVGGGALCYAAYVVWIGGDFMAGRFLSALVVVMVVVMVRERIHLAAHGLPLLFVLVFLQIHAHNPTTKNNKGWDGHQNNAGVSDERGFYFHGTGLVYARPGKIMPDHHWRLRGLKAREDKVRVTIEGSIGMFGLYAGAGVHIIDPLALSDPLLAHLPMQREPGVAWRPGHYIRVIPPEYPKAAVGQDSLRDPDLRRFYEVIQLITRGPLFSWARWEAIWGLHTGRYRPWLKRYRQQAYSVYGEKELGRAMRPNAAIQGVGFLRLSADGAGVRLQQPSAALYNGSFSLGVSRASTYRVVFFRAHQKVGEVSFRAPGRFHEGLYVHHGQIPQHLLSLGLSVVKVFPEKTAKKTYLSHLIVWRHPLKMESHRLLQRRWQGTPWNARGNLILGGDTGYRVLDVALPRLFYAPKIHFSADGNDDMEFVFFYGRKEVGRAVQDANPSSRGGLQVYTLDVPVAARKAGYNRIVARPFAGDGVFSMGHLVLVGH